MITSYYKYTDSIIAEVLDAFSNEHTGKKLGSKWIRKNFNLSPKDSQRVWIHILYNRLIDRLLEKEGFFLTEENVMNYLGCDKGAAHEVINLIERRVIRNKLMIRKLNACILEDGICSKEELRKIVNFRSNVPLTEYELEGLFADLKKTNPQAAAFILSRVVE